MNLRTAISDYKENGLRVLHGIERFYQNLTLSQAIEYAASGADPNGKINSHQRRIGIKRLRKSAAILKRYASEIKRARSFSELFIITEEVKTANRGLGDLWSYDTALRIAFNRGPSFRPQAVFIQAGVTKGVKKIFPQKKPAGRALPIQIFPKPLQKLEAFEIENFLCIWGRQKKG